MPHDNRPLMKPQPACNFDEVFETISLQPQKTICGLKTTGGVDFIAQSKTSHNKGQFILLPHNNRIYRCCWGNTNNHMGKEGQRVGHYTRPLDEWCKKLLEE